MYLEIQTQILPGPDNMHVKTLSFSDDYHRMQLEDTPPLSTFTDGVLP